jgi:hypothetical protein
LALWITSLEADPQAEPELPFVNSLAGQVGHTGDLAETAQRQYRTITSATVTLTNPQALDSLTFNGPAPGSIIVSGSGTSVITLTGAASAADYQTALRQITFDNTGTNPSTETRIIDVVVNDGTVASNLAHAIIEVIQVNDSAPTLDLDGDQLDAPGTSTARRSPRTGHRSRLRTPIPSSAIPISAARSLQPPSRWRTRRSTSARPPPCRCGRYHPL